MKWPWMSKQRHYKEIKALNDVIAERDTEIKQDAEIIDKLNSQIHDMHTFLTVEHREKQAERKPNYLCGGLTSV